MKGFLDKLVSTATRNDSLLCVGLDPDPVRFPSSLLDEESPIFSFNSTIIDATRHVVCAYKPNFAFYEAEGLAGLDALKRTIEYVPDEIPIILDAKRGDIGSTARAYARAAFDVWGADALTVNPYLGHDALSPFLEYEDKGLFLLCHTSNPGAGDFQSLICDGRPLFEVVAERALEWGLSLVVGATYPQVLAKIRDAAPDVWILVPGIGAQGGDLEAALEAGLNEEGQGLIINASRSIIYAPDPRAAALELRDRINQLRRRLPHTAREGRATSLKKELTLALHDLGCVRFGDFTLVSGQRSPIYLDLRLLVSSPQLLSRVAKAYANILKGLTFYRLAAIPYAALPIGTAVSLEMGLPLVYPRKEVKEHGTARGIEGYFEEGERVAVLDDLITTGGSKLRAIAPLEEAGLEVKDVVVLVDRGQGGAEELAEQGYTLHSVLGLKEMLSILTDAGRITPGQKDEVLAFLGGDSTSA
jgi:uridine monophosphate synthetase